MTRSFHLSLPVRSVEGSVELFEILGGTVSHRDPSGYVNVDLCGAQITLAAGAEIVTSSVFHFGVNVPAADFDVIAARLRSSGKFEIVGEPRVVDAGTAIERKKMYVRCPTGYLVEIKSYG